MNEIQWEHWEYANIYMEGVMKHKIKLVKRYGTGQDFMNEFEKAITGYAYHLFRAIWQKSPMK